MHILVLPRLPAISAELPHPRPHDDDVVTIAVTIAVTISRYDVCTMPAQ